MLIRYYGGGISKEYLRDITNTDKSGVNAYDLIIGAKKIGFNAFGVKGEITDLKNNNLPCIAHVIYKKSFPHFIVIYKIIPKKEILLIADPNKNHLTKMTFEEFKKISTKNYILLRPYKKIMYVSKNTKLKELMYDFISDNKNNFIKIIFISFVITLFQVLLSFKFKIILDYVINYQTINNLFLLVIIFLSIIIVKEISNNKRNSLVNKLNHDLDKSLFTDVYNHILSLPYLYYKNRTTGEIIARMNDLVNIRNAISKFVVTSMIDLLLMVGALIVLGFLSLKLMIITIITLLLVLLIIFIYNKPLDDKISKAKEYNANVNSYLVESISGIETIKHQNMVPYSKKHFLLKYLKFNRNSFDYNKTFINFDFIKNLIINISDLLLLIIGSYLVVEKELDLASLITFITLNSYVLNPIDNFTDLILSFKDAIISFNRIKELYEVEEEKDSNDSKRNIIGNISTNHLNYSYNNTDFLLKNINIDIKSGENVLIYGKSGCGKSTLAKILTGDLKIDNKKVFINSSDLNRYKISDLRKNICYISNQEMIFTDTVYNNIILDKEKKNFDEIVKLCMVDEFIENEPLTYDLLLEEGGFNLSSGQKQRIILARSLLKNANIYILDEALNQVDIDKERLILSNLFKKYPNKTFIYISHRFNNSDLFDKKYRIEDGVSYYDNL